VSATPRNLFLPTSESRAFTSADAVPLGHGRSIPPVHVVETMVRALELEPSDRVLEVSCGSGYQSAVLAKLARLVVAVESDIELATHAGNRLRELGVENVEVHRAEASGGWPAGAPYRAIIVGGAATELPYALVEQLAVGGRLVVALGSASAQLVTRVRRGATSLTTETVGLCRLDMLPAAARRPSSFPWVPERDDVEAAPPGTSIGGADHRD
jgi:protein-L-isoaspartate(D-aspartate) O-methyltransferase